MENLVFNFGRYDRHPTNIVVTIIMKTIIHRAILIRARNIIVCVFVQPYKTNAARMDIMSARSVLYIIYSRVASSPYVFCLPNDFSVNIIPISIQFV